MKPPENALLTEKSKNMARLHKIVAETNAAEDTIVQDSMNPTDESETWGTRATEALAKFGGSWTFILLFLGVLIVWILFNSLAYSGWKIDPYPFILLNLILSSVAAMQAPLIMMSQIRQERKDRTRNENDHVVNLKTEMQIRSLQQKMDMLLEDQMMTLFKTQEKQYALIMEIDMNLKALSAHQAGC